MPQSGMLDFVDSLEEASPSLKSGWGTGVGERRATGDEGVGTRVRM